MDEVGGGGYFETMVLNILHLKNMYNSVGNKMVSFLFLPAFFCLVFLDVRQHVTRSFQRLGIMSGQTLNNVM